MNFANPIAMIGNAVEFLFVYICAYIVLTPKWKLWQILPFCYLGLAAGYYLSGWVFVEKYLLRTTISYGLSILPTILLYKDKLYIKLIFHAGVLLCIAIAELLCMTLFSGFTEADYFEIYSLYVSIIFVMLLLYGWIFYRAHKQKHTDVPYKDRAALLLVPFTQVAALTGWVKVARYSSALPGIFSDGIFSAVFVLLMCIFADWMLFKTLKRSAANARLEAENSALTEQVLAQEKYYSVLNTQFGEIRKIRHDISNHMYTISALIDEGKSEEASGYAEAYLAEASKASFNNVCTDPYANAFLCHKLSELKQCGLAGDFEVQLAEHPGISGVDITIVLGNLLDNAIEACRELPESVVKLRVNNENGFISFATENPCSPEPGEHKQRFDGMDRGVGSRILEGVAAKYNGSYTHSENNGVYRAVVSLKTEP